MFTFPVAHFGGGVGFTIDQALRFNDDDSASLNRTPGSAGNRRTWTFSCWVKRGNLTGANQPIFSAGGDHWLMFLSAETLGFNTSGSNYRIVTSQVFRDPGAWFHLVLRVDTTASAGDRLRLYINGSEVTSFGTDTNPTLNLDTAFNNTGEHRIGKLVGASQYFDGYLAEIHHVDGTSLGPDVWGEQSSDGVWIPKKPSGISYGTTGFHVDGSNSSDLGEDQVGSNDWTSNNLAAADSVSDSPTVNWCVWNPIDTSFNNNVTSDGNLKITTASPGYTRFQLGTFGVTSGKWEWKWTPTASLSDGGIGVDDGTSQAATGASSGAFSSQSANGFIYRSNGQKLVGGSVSSYGATFAADDVIRCQIDLDADTPTIEFFKNDASQGSINMNAGVTYFPCQFSADAGLVTVADFGQSGFTAAAGFNTLNTASLPTPSIKDGSAYFQPTLYTGTGSSRSVDQSGNSTFQPDWVWVKSRGTGADHALYDVLRGVQKELKSNDSGAEATITTGLTAFESDGFQVGSRVGMNGSSATFVAWQWKANGSGSSNEDGATTSTVSASATSGFSIVKWTGTGANTTLGHGLGVAPQMILVKNLADADSWVVYNEELGATKGLTLDTIVGPATVSTFFNNTAPTSSVFSIGAGGRTNGSSDAMIAYCFADIPGYSKFGSYKGNSSTNGPFVYTGFKPNWILFRSTSGNQRWYMLDVARATVPGANIVNTQFFAELVNAQSAPDQGGDFLSNGFKLRTTGININGQTIIYMAFAENPFGGDGVAPATAR